MDAVPHPPVGAPTPAPPQSPPAWVEIRQAGKLLFEYDPANGRVRLRRWGREFVVELAQAGQERGNKKAPW